MATDIKLPDPETFTRKELAERWNCDISLIDRYIDNGQLREGVDTFGSGCQKLRDLCYFICEDDDVTDKLLGAIEKDKPLSGFTKLTTTLISCPQYLYNPRGRKTISYLRYFYDRDGKILIPIENTGGENYITFPSIWKRNFKGFIIPLEEVLRFEKEHRIGEKGGDASSRTTDSKKGTTTQEPNSADSAEKNDDLAFKPRPNFDPYMSKKEVSKFIGFSMSFIDQKLREGKFPEPIKQGRHSRWRTSAIVSWMEERKKENDKEADE